ncbi:MAG: ATP-binding protein [Bacteroidales bacterium]|nr:ATP-binding protein [Bacteroidales bacterium]
MLVKRFEPLEGRNIEIIETVMNSAEVTPLPEDVQFKVRLCVEEVEENILCYSGSTWIELRVYVQNGRLVISFCDGGVEFNPLDKEDPDISAPLEKRSIGGLGILLCKKMMDSLSYKYEDGRNYLTLEKKIA